MESPHQGNSNEANPGKSWADAADAILRDTGTSFIDSEEFIKIYEGWLGRALARGKINTLFYINGLHSVRLARSGVKKMSELL